MKTSSKDCSRCTMQDSQFERDQSRLDNNPKCKKSQITRPLRFCSDRGSELEFVETEGTFQSTSTELSRWHHFSDNSLSVSTELESSGFEYCEESTSLLSSEIQLQDADDDSVHSDDSDNKKPLIPSCDRKVSTKDAIFSNEMQQQITVATLSMIDNLYWFSRNYYR